jgi:hypothetical protein
MKSKKKAILGIAFGLLVLLLIAAYVVWSDRPPYEAAYRAIEMGMTEAEVERLVARPPANVDPERRQGAVLAIEWEGVRGRGHAPYPAEGSPYDPTLKESMIHNQDGFYAWGHAPGTGIVVSEAGTGKLVAKGKHYAYDLRDELFVLYDPTDGRVIEKVHLTFQVESPWLRRIKNWLPF